MKKNLLYLFGLSFLCLSFTLKGKDVLENSFKKTSNEGILGSSYKLKKALRNSESLLTGKNASKLNSFDTDPTEEGELSLTAGHQVQIPYADANAILSGSFTIEFWVKLNQDPGDNDKLLSNHGRFSNNNTTGLSIEMPSDNSVSAVFGTNTGGWNSVNSGAPITIGQWNHIALTAVPNETIKIYVNGEFKTQTNYETFVPNENWDLALGTSINYGGETISEMDDFRIWSVAKTDEEIHQDMYLTITEPTDNLVYNFNFNQEDNGTIVNNGSQGDITYTNASIIESHAPTREMDAQYTSNMAADWSVKKDNHNGFYLQEDITDAESNLVVGKENGNQVLHVLNQASNDTLYLDSRWLLDPRSLATGSPEIDLTKVFDNLNNVDLVADEYYLLTGNPADEVTVLATGTKENNMVTFPAIDLSETTVYLAWKNINEYPEGSFPVEAQSVWKYNDTGVDLGSDWKNLGYDDSNWDFGNAILGYGDGVESTTLDYGNDAGNKYPTYYLRYTFNVEDATAYGDLIFRIMKDDGVVVYLNGTEVSRLNMPDGNITYNTYASSAIGGSDESFWNQVEVENLLQDGENVIAVELHQGDAGSSDLRFDMEVNAELPPLNPASYPLTKESAWNYLDTGIDLGAEDWTSLDYDNSSWSRGIGSLGYGDPVNTQISYGSDSGNKFITSYYERDIDLTLTDLSEMVEFGLKRDDGAIVYVNGVEVFRDNMPEGEVNYLTHSAEIADGIEENIYYTHEVPKTAFQEGLNRIAIEVHNRDGQSSDSKFDMYIKNTPEEEFDCYEPHIGCFTSIVPTAQTNHLIIPEEHNFQLIFKQGDQYMDGSGTVPGNNDFTGYVPIEGSSELGYLSVNHENTPGGVSIVDLHLDTETNLWVLDNSQPVDLYNDALVTTTRNCSGGVTPWGTIVTAEESTNVGDVNGDGYQDVGWLVEIDPETSSVMDYGNGQEKLWAMGRMNHENVVVSPDGTTAYYGEDGGTDCVYKYVMDTPGDLSAGTVYVLKLNLPLSNDDPSTTAAEWIEVPNDTQEERNNITATAEALGGTNFNGVEDCEISPLDGKVYFTSKGKGRVYRFTDNGETVTNFETFLGGMDYEITTSEGTFNEAWGYGNDNLTFDDKGNLWVLQDGGNNYIWVVRPDHTQGNPDVELFASMPAGSEPTGLTFTPDYKYGFFSIQHPSGGNAAQEDATRNDVSINASSTVVISLKENLGIQTPVVDFEANELVITEGESINFTDLSTNVPDTWEWTFEGGTPATSNEAAPIVMYDTPGVYAVTLTASNVAGEDTVTKTDYIEVQEEFSVEDINPFGKNVSLYPNPTKGNLTVEISDNEAGKDISVEVFDLLGRKVKNVDGVQTNGNTQHINIDFSQFSQADQLFILQVTIGGKSGRFKIVKTH